MFCQLLSSLFSWVPELLIPCRSAGLVRLGPNGRWVLLCFAAHSIIYSVVEVERKVFSLLLVLSRFFLESFRFCIVGVLFR